MISYAGIPLTLLDPGRDAARILAIQDFIDGLNDLDMPTWNGMGPDWQIPDYGPQHRTKLGRLYWPRSASRFAVGRFLATELQLQQIRDQSYVDSSAGQVALPLIISDGTASITTNMFMLSPRPVYQWDGPPAQQTGDPNITENLYLLTLVDQRYWWWRKAARLTITSGQSWETTFNNISDALGLPAFIDYSDIPSAYLTPAQDLGGQAQFLPPMLDAISASVGQRICVKLDGSVVSQSMDDATDVIRTLVTNTTITDDSPVLLLDRYQIGGMFRFDYTSPYQDLVPLVPDTVQMFFPIFQITDTNDPQKPCAEGRCGADTFSIEVSLSSLQSEDFPWYTDIQVKRGQKVFHTTAIAWYYQSTLQNSTELTDLATQLAKDWYGWQAWGYIHEIVPGILRWEGEAAHDYVEWEAFPTLRTRIVRENFNDLAQWVFQQSTRPPNTSSGDPGSSGTPYEAQWFVYQDRCENGYLNRWRQLLTLDRAQFNLTAGEWTLDAPLGCCGCVGYPSSGMSSGSPTPDDCVSGITGGIPWLIQRELRFQVLFGSTELELQAEVTVSYIGGGQWTVDEIVYPCAGELPTLSFNRYTAMILPDGSAIELIVLMGDTGAGWTATLNAFIPMPPYGAGFVDYGAVAVVSLGGGPPYPYCDGFDVDEDVNRFTFALIGESCAYPPEGMMPPDCEDGADLDVIPLLIRVRLADGGGGYDPNGEIIAELDTVMYQQDPMLGCNNIGANLPCWQTQNPGPTDPIDVCVAAAIPSVVISLACSAGTDSSYTGGIDVNGSSFPFRLSTWDAGFVVLEELNLGTGVCGSGVSDTWMEIRIG